jgi:hypothetical protein
MVGSTDLVSALTITTIRYQGTKIEDQLDVPDVPIMGS